MSQYYYALSSLPTLMFDSDQFPTEQEFLQICADWLTPVELMYIHGTQITPAQPQEKNELIRRWEGFESELRNELVRLRAGRLKKEPQEFLRMDEGGVAFQGFGTIADAAKNAVADPSPYAAEKILNQLRWNYLEELSVGHFFDVQSLQVYYLKLQILQRNAQLNKEQGEKRFTSQYEQLSETISESNKPVREGME